MSLQIVKVEGKDRQEVYNRYRISQNFRDLKISQIAAKTGVRNVRE